VTLFSILTPVFNPDRDVLSAMIESVLAQEYGRWELLLVDDASTEPHVREVLEDYARRDERIRVIYRAENGGISRASNDALEQARGEFVALLDHDDLLHPEALAAVNHVLVVENPTADLVYTDEDKVDAEGHHYDTFHKPGWSPEYLEGCMYLGHLCVYRRSVIEEVGGFRTGLDGSQDWDLALRVTERSDRVHHIPRVLYHWRSGATSAAQSSDNKRWATASGRQVIEERLKREKTPGKVEDTLRAGWFHLIRTLQGQVAASLIVPTRGTQRPIRGTETELISNCIASVVERTEHDNYEIVCLINGSPQTGLEQRLSTIAGSRIRFIHTGVPFNFSTVINLGALHARGNFLVLLNDDVEVISGDWLTRMLEIAQRDSIGAVGAKLLLENGRIQHAGVVHAAHGAPYHPHHGQEDGVGYFGDLMLNMNYLAVTGACLAVRREVFEEVGGLNPDFPLNYNDVDFCLKLISRGYRNVQVNAAKLYHYETSTRPRSVTYQEVDDFLRHWAPRTLHDPFVTAAHPS